MNQSAEHCPLERMYEAEFRHLTRNLSELKARVQRLESALTRGLFLLVANLAGVVTMLVRQLL